MTSTATTQVKAGLETRRAGSNLVLALILTLCGCGGDGTRSAAVPEGIRADQKVLDLGQGVSMELVRIPAGKYLMGSASGGPDERPAHEVTFVEPFYMSATEVTQAQFHAVTGFRPSIFGKATRPVENVSWQQAREFCELLSRKAGITVRLPSEAEWEYAARAGSTTRWSFGEDELELVDHAWFSVNSEKTTHDVGTLEPNAWGLHDTLGNVAEWCADSWHRSYSGAPGDGSAWIDGGEPDTHVYRGGSWATIDVLRLQPTFRNRAVGDVRGAGTGFRIAVTETTR